MRSTPTSNLRPQRTTSRTTMTSNRVPERQPCVIKDAARGMGIAFIGTRGSGKSRTIGRAIAWHDLMSGMPLVVLDPAGGTIDNILDKIRRLPLKQQEEI